MTNLAEHLMNFEIDFDYRFDESIHDRFIVANNGWRINIGRGLDIYKRIEDRYSMAWQNPLLRRCRNTSISFQKYEME